MTRMEEYAFTKADKALPSTPVKTIRGTFDSTWKDQLLTWNGVSMTYDAIGNMVKKGNTTYTWTQGRKLSTVNNGKKIQYFYDHTGRRVRKTVDGVITDFRMAGELLMSQKAGDVTTYFSYDSAGNLIGMSAGSNRYFYTRNAQNDITGLIDEKGTSVVQYQYDSWGKLLGITGSLASTIGKRNPFRYRGYYYDDETGMYYLQSRYYDPEIKRFICADNMKILQEQMDLYNKNLYAYCDNNPVVRLDLEGELGISIGLAKVLIGAAANVVTSFMAAKVTNQSFGIGDAVIAGAAGAFSSWEKIGMCANLLGGIVAGGATYFYKKIQGKDDKEAIISGVSAGVATASAFSGLTGKGVNISLLEKGASDSIFGLGANLTSAAVSKATQVEGTENRGKNEHSADNNRHNTNGKRYMVYFDYINHERVGFWY